MNNEINKVRLFRKVFGLPISETPEIPNPERCELMKRLINEEIGEMLGGLKCNNIAELADGLIDSMYILIGIAHECGIADKLEAMFEEVHRSNMSKLDENGEVLYREDGKVLKSDLFFPPDLETILKN